MATVAAAWTPEALAEIEDNYLDERSARWLYASLANLARHPRRKELLEHLAGYEEQHADRWGDLLRRSGRKPPADRRFLEHRLLVAAAAVAGVGSVLPLLHKMEVDGIGKYRRQALEWPAASRTFAEILPDEIVHEVQLFTEMREDGQRGAIRSAILGVNDGLSSILALTAGVAAGTSSSHAVLIAGVSGLVAGAASMAASGYVSVKAEREVFEMRLELEREAVHLAPEAKERELADDLAKRGWERREAENAARRLSGKPESFFRAVLAAQGLADESDLESPGMLALYTGVSFFAAGAIPLVPYFFLRASTGVEASIAVTALALFAAGLFRSLATLKSFARSGLEMVLVGLGSAAVTYAVGWAIGGGVAG
jgi:vacuolar iron transporter family protein